MSCFREHRCRRLNASVAQGSGCRAEWVQNWGTVRRGKDDEPLRNRVYAFLVQHA